VEEHSTIQAALAFILVAQDRSLPITRSRHDLRSSARNKIPPVHQMSFIANE